MQQNSGRYGVPFIVVHWLLGILILVLLGLGLYIQSLPPEAMERAYLLDVHISLGLTSLILIVLQITMRLIHKPPPLPERYPERLAKIGSASFIVMYLCMLLLPLSGYLQAVFSGTEVKFWGFALPGWGIQDSGIAEFLWTLHGIVGFVLIGFLIIHVAIVAIGTINGYGIAGRMLPGGPPKPKHMIAEAPPGVSKIAQKLSRTVRLYGWVMFWLQLALAFISGLLLVFATSGRAFSPGSTGIGDGMFWAALAFLIVWVTIIISFYYTRAAGKISLLPDAFINPDRKLAFWFLGLGVFVGIVGLLASLVGVGASISLLIAKTVSQPPGIAITDPNKIIRALDVFILLVNFSLLMAHFIGTGISVWLSISATKARLAFHKVTGSGEAKGKAEQLEPA